MNIRLATWILTVTIATPSWLLIIYDICRVRMPRGKSHDYHVDAVILLLFALYSGLMWIFSTVYIAMEGISFRQYVIINFPLFAFVLIILIAKTLI
jgi:hypothetical protein